MAIEKIINIKVDAKDAVKGVDSITGALEGVEKQAENSQDAVEDVGKSAKDQTRVVKGLGTAVKGVGVALKAIGIGLIIALVAKLTEVFSRNQKVVDFFSTTMTTLSIIFTDVFNVITDVVSKISEATGGFDAFGKVIKGLLTLALTPLKLAFFGITLAVQETQLAWEESFFGGKDKETIKELNLSILETKKNLIKVGEDALKAGKQISDNFIEAVGEFSTAIETIATDGIKGIRDISVSAAIEQAKAITQAQNNFELLALTQARLMLQYQNEAELLRQIRDDEAKSIEERIRANTELADVLDRQFVAEQESIKQRIASLQQEQNLLGVTIERTNEIFQLQTDLIDVEERLQGQRSEQLVNSNALLREQIELNQTISDSEKERRLAQIEFDASQQEFEADKINLLRERLELENEILLEDLERKRELFAEGTQARIDAEQDFLTRKQELDNQSVALNKQANDQQEKDEQSLGNAKLQIGTATFNALGSLAKEGSELAKGIAASQATINTIQGVTSALSAVSVIPDPFGTILKFANAAAIGVSGAINVKKILATQPVTKSAPSTLGGGGSSAPAFNLVQGTGTNQISDSIEQQDTVTRSVVVSSDVTTAQSADRNTIESSTL